jgi:cell pole-organizing protein PopZ
MTDQTAQEPTMEEILASIRRIISEDDAPAETAAAAPEPVVEIAPEPEPIFPAAAEAPAPVEEEVLELTERYEAPAAESIGDLEVADVAPFPAAAEPVAAPVYDSLVGESAAASAASAFAGLAATFQKPEAPVAAPQDLPFVSGNTVEAMVQAMLRPMLKEWLDANLPGIVEAQVRKEVERIARNAG